MTDIVVYDGVDIIPKRKKRPVYIPSLFDINKTFDVIKVKPFDGIKGEYHNRMVVFTNFVLGKKCILLAGNRSTGKTALMQIVSAYCPNPAIISQASDKADFRNVKLNESTHFIVPEINKVNDKFIEIMKDHGEGASHVYNFLDEFKQNRSVIIDPKPFITSLADENDSSLGAELISRLTVINMDASIEQNKRVIEEKLLRAQNPFRKEEVTQDVVKQCIEYVKNLPNIYDYQFIYLPGTSVKNVIPPIFTDSRRDTDKYLENTKGVALFHFFDRLTFVYKNKKIILITPEDVWYNHIIYNKILVKSALKCNDTERKVIELLTDKRRQKKKGISESDIPVRFTVTQIHKELLRLGYTHSLPTVKKYCERLTDIGYVIKDEDTRPPMFEINSSFTSEYESTIDWNKIVEECKRAVREIFPEYADEYIRRFCTPPIIVKNPFTGEEIDILSSSSEGKSTSQNTITKKESDEGIIIEDNVEDRIQNLIISKISDGSEKDIVILLKEISDELDVPEADVDSNFTILEKKGVLFTKGTAVKKL